MTKNKDMIFLITNIPTPYRIPLFNQLNSQLKGMSLRFKVLFGARGYARRKWKIDLSSCKFEYKVLPSLCIKLSNHERVMFTYRGLLNLVIKENPEIIITNGFSVATTKLWLLSWFRRVRYIIWSGAIESERRPDPKLRRLHRKLLVRRAVGFIAYGTKAREYMVNLGAKPEKVEIGINTVDTNFFRREVEKCRNKFKRASNKKTLLFVGYLTKGKRLDLLLGSIKILAESRNDFILKIVGDGPEKDNLIRLANCLGISQFISFEGYKQKESLVNYYAEADCFLFPSEYDIWGLVLVEAMAAGVPCIASIHAGAVKDLIEDGITGFVVDFSNCETVAEKIYDILDNTNFVERLGKKGQNFINENITLQISANGFMQAIQRAVLIF